MYVCTDWFLIVAGFLLNGAPRVLAEKKNFGHKILMKQPHDCTY